MKNRESRDVVIGAVIGSIQHPDVIIAGLPDVDGSLIIEDARLPSTGRNQNRLEGATVTVTPARVATVDRVRLELAPVRR